MSPEKPRPRPRRFGIESEEERAWVGFYQRVGRDATVAAEVMTQLESDPEMKRAHLALYLCCKESLRRHKTRQARNKRIGQFVRWLCHGLFVLPLRSLQKGLRYASDIAIECLPTMAREPATAQARRLAQEAEFATARTVFDQQANASASGPRSRATETQVSRSAKTSGAVA